MNEVAAVIFNANCIAILGIISYSSPFIKWWKFRRKMRWRGQANGGRKCGNGAYFVHFYSFEVRQLFAPFFPLASNILVFSIREGVNDCTQVSIAHCNMLQTSVRCCIGCLVCIKAQSVARAPPSFYRSIYPGFVPKHWNCLGFPKVQPQPVDES